MGAPAYTRAWGNVSDGGSFGDQQPSARITGSFEAGVYDYKDVLNDVVTGTRNLYWDDDNKAAFLYDGTNGAPWKPRPPLPVLAYVEEGLGE